MMVKMMMMRRRRRLVAVVVVIDVNKDDDNSIQFNLIQFFIIYVPSQQPQGQCDSYSYCALNIQ
jgi:hypothetical protein